MLMNNLYSSTKVYTSVRGFRFSRFSVVKRAFGTLAYYATQSAARGATTRKLS